MTYHYKSKFNNIDSKCGISIHFTNDTTIIICKELMSNTGMSVTNACEIIANGICKSYQINPLKMIWIEHYENEQYIADMHTYDYVTFKYNTKNGLYSPSWSRLKENKEGEDFSYLQNSATLAENDL